MADCDICFQPTRNRKRTGPRDDLVCNDCRDYRTYWDGLTPDEQREEELAMAAYTIDTKDD